MWNHCRFYFHEPERNQTACFMCITINFRLCQRLLLITYITLLTQLSRWSFSVVKDISSVRSPWACSDLILWSSRLRTHSEVVHLGLMWPHSFSGVNRNVFWATLKEHLHNCRPLKQEEAIPAMGYVLWVTVMWMACSLWYSLTCQRLEAERTQCSNCSPFTLNLLNILSTVNVEIL